jgi:hypothetical protein
MKNLKTFLWFASLMTVCTAASAEPVTMAMAWAAANIPTVLSVAGAAMSAISTIQQGKDNRDLASADAAERNRQSQVAASESDATAAQLDVQAGQQRAAGQRRAQEQRRQAAIASSNVQARTGGGSTDASILGLTGNIAGEGEYNALTNIYEAEESALGAEGQAGTARRQASAYRAGGEAALVRGRAAGDAAVSSSRIGAASTIFSAGSTLYSKYGGGGVVAAGADNGYPLNSYKYSRRGSND